MSTIYPTPINDWGTSPSISPFSVTKSVEGIVAFHGQLNFTNFASTDSSTAFFLPVNYRPTADVVTTYSRGGIPSQCLIQAADGQVILQVDHLTFLNTGTFDGVQFQAAANLSPFLQAALPNLPGAVRRIVRSNLVEVLREFYELSTALRDTIDVNVVADQRDYDIVPAASDLFVMHPLEVYYNGRKIRALKQRPPTASLTQTATQPTGWYRTGLNTVSLYPTPTVALTNGLSVYVSLRPDTSRNFVPAVALAEHFDAILDGLYGRMMKQSAKPYSNLQLSQYHLQRFRSQIALYKGLANKGNVPTGTGWVFERFGK